MLNLNPCRRTKTHKTQPQNSLNEFENQLKKSEKYDYFGDQIFQSKKDYLLFEIWITTQVKFIKSNLDDSKKYNLNFIKLQ